MRKLYNYQNNCLPYYSSPDPSLHLLNSREGCSFLSSSHCLRRLKSETGQWIQTQQVGGYICHLFPFIASLWWGKDYLASSNLNEFLSTGILSITQREVLSLHSICKAGMWESEKKCFGQWHFLPGQLPHYIIFPSYLLAKVWESWIHKTSKCIC